MFIEINVNTSNKIHINTAFNKTILFLDKKTNLGSIGVVNHKSLALFKELKTRLL